MRVEVPPRALVRRLVKMERQGLYISALDLFSKNWRDPAFEPETYGLPDAEAAELVLRFASLIGFIGQLEMIPGAQERSRDLLSRSHRWFINAKDAERAAEAENWISATYSRTGEFDEAEIWLGEALARDIPRTSDVRLQSHMLKSFLLMSRRRHEENVAYCRAIEADLRKNGDAFFNGALNSNAGISCKDLGDEARALEYFTQAREYFTRAKHRIYLGTVHNNLALLYKDMRLYRLAHASAESALGIYRRLGDKAREGSTLETIAQIHLAEGNVQAARASVDRSIKALRKSENVAFLAESIATKGKILIAMDMFADALVTFSKAVTITRIQSGYNDAHKLALEFEAAWNAHKAVSPVESEGRSGSLEMELVLPASLAQYSNYRGVWINTSHLERVGITAGSLAVVVHEPPSRGEPAAVMQHSTGEVTCGIYDADFGMICLETEVGEPILFDESEVEVLGKIVGRCRDERTADGRMIAEPIGLVPGTAV